MIRLQCPACQTIVKVGAETVAQHPIVRCANCQGLVPVLKSIVQDPPPAPSTRRGAPKRRSSRASQTPIIVGIVVGILLLGGGGFALYWFNRTPSANQIAQMKQENIDHFSIDQLHERSVMLMESMITLLESIRTTSDIDNLAQRMEDIKEEESRVDSALHESVRNLPPAERQAAEKKLEAARMQRAVKWAPRLAAVMARLQANPALFHHIPKLDNAFAGGGSSKARPYNNPDTKRISDTRRLEDIAKAVEKRRDLIAKLESVRTTDDLIRFLGHLEQFRDDLRDLRSNSDHYDFNSIPIGTSYHVENQSLDLRLKSALQAMALNKELTTCLSQNQARIRLATLDRVNFAPFVVEVPYLFPTPSFPSPSARRANDDDDDERPSRPRPQFPSGMEAKDVRTMTGRELIAWLKTAHSFRKSEILTQMLLESVSAERKEIFLTVADMFMEDPDIRNKEDVFKLFRKWASTQEDRERVGKHAEEFLKNHSTRETVMRWFADNKVISASKEMARYLKENHHFEKSDAADALITMGSGAEPAVIPYLTALEPKTRHLAIEVLARIGTRECLPALRKLSNDPHVSLAAKQALVIIDKRHPEK